MKNSMILWYRITDAKVKNNFFKRQLIQRDRFTCLPAGVFSEEDFTFFLTEVIKHKIPETDSGVIRYQYDNRVFKYWFDRVPTPPFTFNEVQTSFVSKNPRPFSFTREDGYTYICPKSFIEYLINEIRLKLIHKPLKINAGGVWELDLTPITHNQLILNLRNLIYLIQEDRIYQEVKIQLLYCVLYESYTDSLTLTLPYLKTHFNL